MIIAIGESIVAIGVGASGSQLSWPIIVASLLGLAVSVGLWWTYFDVVALVAERVLASREGTERTRLARDSFTYLHFPMVAGIVFLALGLKKVLEYVGGSGHELTDPLSGVPVGALYGGAAAYLLAHIGFRLRNVGSVNRPRLAVALALIAAVPLGMRLPALAALALLAALIVALVSYEAVRYAEARKHIRHGES